MPLASARSSPQPIVIYNYSWKTKGHSAIGLQLLLRAGKRLFDHTLGRHFFPRFTRFEKSGKKHKYNVTNLSSETGGDKPQRKYGQMRRRKEAFSNSEVSAAVEQNGEIFSLTL